MVFSSPRYLLFLALVLVGLWALKGVSRKKRLLALASCAFYAAWDWRYLGLLLAISVIDYWAADRIARATAARTRKTWLALSIGSNLGLLAYFKYCNFFIANLDALLAPAGIAVPMLDVVLPVGISFYTFKTMSHTIDVYRGQLAPCRSGSTVFQSPKARLVVIRMERLGRSFAPGRS